MSMMPKQSPTLKHHQSMTMIKPILFLGVLPLVFVGCVSTNPKAAFDDLEKRINTRSGEHVEWTENPESQELASEVAKLIQTNLTAQSAVAVALLNNRSLQAGFEEIGISQAEMAQASRLRNPEIVGSWRFPDRPPSAANVGYSATADILDLLTLPARKKFAARNLEQTKLRVAHEVLRLASDVQTAFYTLQAHEQFAKRLNVVVEINEAAADLSKRQHEAGNINDLELFNQQTAYAQSRLDLAQAMAQSRADRERVNRLLGLWGGQTNWKPAEDLPALPEKELYLENIESLAVNQRLDLAAARNQAEIVASALQLKSKTRFLPGVSVGVDTERETDGQRVTGPTLSLELPLFDQGQPALARLAAQYRQAQRNFEALAINIRSEVREARDALIATRDTAEYYQKVLLPQRQRVLHETLLHYNAMQKSSYELLAAKEREQVAERGYVEALRDYWIARVELEKAVGGKLGGKTAASEKSSPEKPTAEHEHHKN
jgi:cobalt-zinc-cadmium efflux system outer membrane protein